MRELDLPSADFFATLVVFSLGIIVLWDGWMIWRSAKEIPSLGNLANGGFAWSSVSNHEAFRQWGNLFSMAAMMVLPWSLASVTDTSIYWLIIWDILLAFHLISLVVPKRYAVTSTHLFADGQRYEWKKLRLAKRQPKRRIMLLRKGWGIFGPLPVGGKYHDLEQAKTAIARFYQMGEESE